MSDQVVAAVGVTVRPTGVRWKIFVLMLFLISINYIDRASLSVAMPMISKEFDIDPAAQGLILSSFFWTYAFMQMPGRHAGRPLQAAYRDRRSRRWSGALFQAIAAASTKLVCLAADPARTWRFGSADLSGRRQAQRIWMTPRPNAARGATLLDGGAPLGAALGAIVIAG